MGHRLYPGKRSFSEGLRLLAETLDLRLPFAACNGAVFLEPDFTIIEQRPLSFGTAQQILEIMADCDLEIWLYKARVCERRT